MVPQFLEWSPHSLAYEITQLAKTNPPHSMATAFPFVMAHILWSMLLSESAQIHLLPMLSLTEFLQWDIKSLSFIRSWSQTLWVLARLKSQEREAEGQEEKAVGKNMLRNPPHSLLENLLNTWPVLTVFIGLILGTKKIKDRRTPTHLGNSY